MVQKNRDEIDDLYSVITNDAYGFGDPDALRSHMQKIEKKKYEIQQKENRTNRLFSLVSLFIAFLSLLVAIFALFK